jgi:hypothetical protein
VTAKKKPTASELLETPGALLTSTHLSELGLTRRAIDAVWRACPVVVLAGYKRPMIRVEDYLTYIEEHTYREDEPRVRRPTSRSRDRLRPSSRSGAGARERRSARVRHAALLNGHRTRAGALAPCGIARRERRDSNPRPPA